MPTYFCPCQTASSVSKAFFNLKAARQINPDEPVQSVQATVVSRTVKPNNDAYRTDPWLYLAIFRLEDGTEVELQTGEAAYGTLKEETKGRLSYQSTLLLSFTPSNGKGGSL